MSVRLNPTRARRLLDNEETDDVEWLTHVLLEGALASGHRVRDVVYDVEDSTLRGLLTYERDGELHVLACAPEEALEVTMHIEVPSYATEEALALSGEGTEARSPALH